MYTKYYEVNIKVSNYDTMFCDDIYNYLRGWFNALSLNISSDRQVITGLLTGTNKAVVTYTDEKDARSFLNDSVKRIVNGIIGAHNHNSCSVTFKFHEIDGFGMSLGQPDILYTHGKQEQVSSTVAVNDHTCPTCKNHRCSRSEKICWKCGYAL